MPHAPCNPAKMGADLSKSHIAVRSETGELEVIDMITGEVVKNSVVPLDVNAYRFDYAKAVLICQEIRKGRTLKSIGEDPDFPPLEVITHWQRNDRYFAQELIIARKDRAEHHFDKVAELADEAAQAASRMSNRDEISAGKLAIDSYKWLAEKGDSERFGKSITHQGSEEKPILMRVINTGINRTPVTVEVQSKEIIDVKPERKFPSTEETGEDEED